MNAREAIQEEIREREDVGRRLERRLPALQSEILKLQGQIQKNCEEIEALARALAVLREHSAPPVADPLHTPEPVAEEPTPEPEPISHTPHALRDPLRVHPKGKGRKGVKDRRPRAPRRTLAQRAEDVIIAEQSSTTLERGELIVMLLHDSEGKATSEDLRLRLKDVLSCGEATATGILSRVLPVLMRAGRVSVKDADRLQMEYEISLTPAEAASNRLGVGGDYAGTTTRWPTPSTTPARGTRITVDSGPFEMGKGR